MHSTWLGCFWCAHPGKPPLDPRQKQVQEEFEGIRGKGEKYLKEIQEYYVFPIIYAHVIDKKKNFHQFILRNLLFAFHYNKKFKTTVVSI